MDEKQISELLECSVCFEQLDQSCKVLPCQHTFCRRCLDEILLRKYELRCPECRTLVTTPVAELPTNILVVRILEGLKTQGHKTSNSWDGGKAHSGYNSGLGSSPSRGLGFSPQRHPHDGHGSQAGYHPRQNQPCAKALYTYESTEKEDLAFKKGDMIVLRRQIDENWYLGEFGGKSGFFPANFVQVMVPLPQIPQSKALYDFDLKDENEKDCLSFKKDEVISVIRKVDDNWLEGRQGDKIGIFPISFVELNDAARMLINSKTNMTSSTISVTQSSLSALSPTLLSVTAATISSSSPTSVTTVVNHDSSISSLSSSMSSSTPTDSRLSTIPTTSAQNMSPQNKRHSFTSSSTCSSPLPLDSSQQRHSMEVTSSSDSSRMSISVTPNTSGFNSLPSMAPASSSASESTSASFVSGSFQRTGSFSPSISPTPAPETGSEMQASSNFNVNGGALQSGSLSIPIYVAIYNYLPQKDDELELHKGDHYSVVEKCQDGWFKGSCIKTGQAGVFPGNYVTVLRHTSAFKPMNPNILNIRAKSPNTIPSQSSSSHGGSTLPQSSSSQRPDPSLDSSVTSGPPPLMPRVAKMTPGSKSRQTASHLMAIPLRSLSHPGTPASSSSSSSTDPSLSFSAPISSSRVLDPSTVKGKPLAPQVPSVFTSPNRNKTWISSHHHHQRISSTHPPLSATTITPPNVVMASSQDASSSLLHSLSKEKDKKKKKEEKKRGSLFNLLKERKSKHMSSSSEAETQPLPVVSLDGVSHTRSGSFPAESCLSSSMHHRGGGDGGEPTIEHRKAISLDSTSSTAPPIPDKPRARAPARNKYCCVVPYPPQMNYELGLEMGDIVYVLRERDDGWFKGTHERTGKTGMFPAIFVEKCD